jgi:Ca2+-binding RTX toxin-like protein
MGYISYLVAPKAGVTTGTEIRSVAHIIFDGMQAIATNQVSETDPSLGTDPSKEALVTIDANAPVSAVLPLPSQVTGTDFLVSWAGNDNGSGVEGSGILSYAVSYADITGGIPPVYVRWFEDTDATSATFTGLPGHTYAFYTVATDHVGQTEIAPATPDAQTTVNVSATLPGGVLVGGVLTITGTSGDDSISLTNAAGTYRLDVTSPVGNVTQQFNGVTSIIVNALAGNDAVVLGAGVIGATINGGDGNDTLSSGPGSDTLAGGAGNDTYVFGASAAAQTDTVVELSGQGEDTLDFSGLTAIDGVTLNLATTTTALGTHTSRTVVVGSSGQAANLENVKGGAGNDLLTGNASANVLTGNGGSDAVTGGSGDDTYVFGTATTAETDKITELTNGGVDTLDFGGLGSGVPVTINLASTTAALGSHANRTLILGSSGQAAKLESVTGGAGNDSITGNSAANVLIGNAGNDTLNGGSGNDTLNGGEGSDGLVGGSGGDTYIFATALLAQTDTITELSSGGTDTLDFGGLSASEGVTINLASTTTALGSHTNRVVNLASAGTAAQMENVTGGAGNDTVTGNAAVNVLIGNAGNDTLNGGSGNDTLTGGEGSDSLIGGTGNDNYLFATALLGQTDVITELSGGGTEFLDFTSLSAGDGLSINLASTTTALGGHANRVINLASAGTTTPLENVTGGAGNDNITGNAASNVLTGNAGNDTLVGNAGNDTLTGGEGSDILIGGAGNDAYIFATVLAAQTDSITELSSGGTDTLNFSALGSTDPLNIDLTSTTTALGSHTNRTLVLGASGQAAQLENVTGGAGNDNLTGNASVNLLTGNAGNDTLRGNGGNDTLTGGAGSDTLAGGSANDLYVFAAASSLEADTVIELSNDGVDTLSFSGLNTTTGVTINLASTSTALGAHTNRTLSLGVSGQAAFFENVTGGSGADNITGNAADNVLTGNSGNDTLSGNGGSDTLTGGVGSDTLAGGAGNDLYVFAAATASETDTVAELSNDGTDTLSFSGLGSSTGVTVNLASATTSLGSHTNRVLNLGSSGQAAFFENVTGGAGADALTGNAADNVLTGNSGNDILTGNGGNDLLTGGSGSDVLVGGAANDLYIFASASALETDTLVEFLNEGTDTLSFSGLGSSTGVTVNLASTTTSLGSHTNRTLNVGSSGAAAFFENVTGGAGADTITGNAVVNTLVGNGGNDKFFVRDSVADVIDGGGGSDSAQKDNLDQLTSIETLLA